MNFKEKISSIIKFDISQLFSDVVNFYDQYHNMIIQYYTVEDIEYPKEAFEILKSLSKDVDFVLAKLNFYKGNFSNTGYWDILEQLDDIKQKFDLIYIYPKLYKVSFVKLRNQKKKFETYVQKQNETIEQIANKFDENWEDLALLNNFKEEDYTNAGGKKFMLRSTITNSITVPQIDAVFDICLGSNTLGKDIPNYFEFDIEENDLKVNSPRKTFLYTVKRLFQLVKGSIPEFPSIGIDKGIMSESVKGDGFFFPILLRQVSETIQTDDTIISFSIDSIEKENDTYLIQATVQDRLLNNLKFESSLEDNTDDEITGNEYLHIYNKNVVVGDELSELVLENQNADADTYIRSNTKWNVNLE